MFSQNSCSYGTASYVYQNDLLQSDVKVKYQTPHKTIRSWRCFYQYLIMYIKILEQKKKNIKHRVLASFLYWRKLSMDDTNRLSWPSIHSITQIKSLSTQSQHVPSVDVWGRTTRDGHKWPWHCLRSETPGPASTDRTPCPWGSAPSGTSLSVTCKKHR